MADPYLAVTLDAKRRIARAAKAIGAEPGPFTLGYLDLLEHVWERKDPRVTALVLAACFGSDPRVPATLVEFGFVVACEDTWELNKDDTDRLLLTHKQRVAAGKARAEGAARAGGAFTSGGPADPQRRTSRPPAADQLLHPAPSTQHPAETPPPPRGGEAPNVVPLRTPAEEEGGHPFWEFTQAEREKLGRSREVKPEGFDAWARTAEGEVGPQRLSAAYCRYLADDHFSLRGWPMPVFQSPKVWRQRANQLRDRDTS